MSTETLPAVDLAVVGPAEQKELATIVSKESLQAETAQSLTATFAPLFGKAREVMEKSLAIVVTDASQKMEMKLAAVCRKELKAIRVAGDKLRKELKEESLRKSRAIDGFNNILDHMIATEEDRLERQEKFVELKEQERKAELKTKREEVLRGLQIDPGLYSLGEMTDDTFNTLVEGTRLARAAQAEKARKDEADRIEREQREAAERERIRLENERLKKEADEKEAALRLEREQRAAQEREAAEERERQKRLHAEQLDRERVAAQKAAAEEKRIADEKAKAEREALEKKHAEERRVAAEKVRKEREVREKLEAELKAKREAEEKRLAEQKRQQEEAEAERRKAAAAPDKDRLMTYANAIRAIEVPELATNGALTTLIEQQRNKFIAWLESSTDKL